MLTDVCAPSTTAPVSLNNCTCPPPIPNTLRAVGICLCRLATRAGEVQLQPQPCLPTCLSSLSKSRASSGSWMCRRRTREPASSIRSIALSGRKLQACQAGDPALWCEAKARMSTKDGLSMQSQAEARLFGPSGATPQQGTKAWTTKSATITGSHKNYHSDQQRAVRRHSWNSRWQHTAAVSPCQEDGTHRSLMYWLLYLAAAIRASSV